jgi:predicted dinucleotide-binding enzyme
MNIGVLGTGIVGRTIGTALVLAGHSVRMGSRSADNAQAVNWKRTVGDGASHGTFAEAAAFGSILFNCTAGTGSLEALRLAGEENLEGKVLIDLSNPLDFSKGFPPTLAVCNTDSLGEQIQRTFPRVRVVKALNTMNCQVMVQPTRVPGPHHVFLAGNDSAAKSEVASLLTSAFGWPAESIVDLGDITGARSLEMVVPLWIRLFGVLGTTDINIHVAGAPARPPSGSQEAPAATARAV